MIASYRLDAARVSAFGVDLLRRAAADPATAELATPELQSLLDLWSRAFTGEASVGLRAASSVPLAAESALKVRDEALALAFMDKAAALLSPGAPWEKLYSGMGMPLRLAVQKNVRRHGSVPVHRFQMKLDAKALSAEQQAQYSLFVRDTDFAFAGGYLLTAADPQALDALLDRAARPPAATALQSARAFGDGAHLYLDYDLFGLLRTVMEAMPAGGAPNPFAGLPSTTAQPMLYAAWLSDERVRIQSKLPLQPIADMMKGLKKPEPAKKVAGAKPR